MSWQLVSFLILAAVLIGGFAWYERSRPPAQVVALVAALAALGRWQDHLPLGTFSFAGLRLHPLSVIFGLHGSAMVSKTLRIPKP